MSPQCQLPPFELAMVAQGKTLLIDCGTDLRPAAVSGVERVLLTHFHRDQCAGLAQWANVRVYIPAAERHFLEESDVQRAGYYLYDNYTAYFPGFGPLADVCNAQLAPKMQLAALCPAS